MEEEMKITEKKVTVRELVEDFEDTEETGARGYGGRLNIRPQYQREFVYNDKEQKAVINSVFHHFPLNTMYWSVTEDGAETPYEMLDGQQRTLSICNYYIGNFDYDDGSGEVKYFDNLTKEEKKQFLDYVMTIYVCQGSARQKLDWFNVINVQGEALEPQERRNAVYAGRFVTDARRWFSKNNCAAYRLSKDIVSGRPIRQDLLEKALKWMVEHEARINGSQKSTINDYMARHQFDNDAQPLKDYYEEVVRWALDTFDVHRFKSIMKDIDWPLWYDLYHDKPLDKEAMAIRIAQLLEQADSKDPEHEIQAPKGIIPFVLTGDEQNLNLRTFSEKQKLAAYTRQKGICPICHKHFKIEEMEADHIIPWAKGGKTTNDNCQMLCRECNRRKSDK